MATPAPFLLRSVYRSLLRTSKPFSPPSPNYAVYASLLHRSGISHDWEECKFNLEKRRERRRQLHQSDDNNKNNNIIPKSWARNLSRSYADLREEYQLRKDSLQALQVDDDDDDDDDDEDWDEAMPIGTSHFLHQEEEYYNADQDPKFILFRHLLREWFAGGNKSNAETNDNKNNNSSSWPKQWSPDEEGYYENGKIHQVPLMRFPSQIRNNNCDNNGLLSLREMIQREFRAPTVEEKYERESSLSSRDGSTDTTSSSSGSSRQIEQEVFPPSSYIDTPIRLQTALYTLKELNRKLAWAEKIGLPSPNDWNATRQAREWKRLVQAAKGVSSHREEVVDEEKCAGANNHSQLLETKANHDDVQSTQSNNEPSRNTSKDGKTSEHPLGCGTLLIAHPLMTGYFANSVIILLDHTPSPNSKEEEDKSSLSSSSSTNTTNEGKSSGGTYGLIVNRLALEAKETTKSQHLEALRQRFEEKKERDLAEILLQSSSEDDDTTTDKKKSETVPQKAEIVTKGSSGGGGGSGSGVRRPISLLQAVQNDDLPETVQLAFGDSPIREGGPVNLSIQMIHRAAVQQQPETGAKDNNATTTTEKGKKIGGTVIPSYLGEEETVSGKETETETTLFGGDVINASYSVLEGVRDADDFSFIIGASCWSPGQLENEIQKGCWLRFYGPSSMAMTGMCDHYDATELEQLRGDDEEKNNNVREEEVKRTKLSTFPPRPSNVDTTLSVAASATRGSNNTQQSRERPVGDLWLSIMCALSQDEADLAYVMLHSSNVKDDLGDACDNFYREN